MRAGTLTEPIEIHSSKITTNEFGEETNEWVRTYSTKAYLKHLNGNRENDNGEIFYASIKTFQVRYYVPVRNFDRIKWNDEFYRVLDIEPNKEQQLKTIKAELVND